MGANTESEEGVASVLKQQEDEYSFPYHYVTCLPPIGFRQHFVDSWGINYASTIDFVLEKIRIDSPTSIIDVGCGDGRMTREILSRGLVPRVCGMDYSIRAINLAKAMNQDIPGLDFVQADIFTCTSLGQYDAVLLMEVFEHIPLNRAAEFLHSVRTLLKPGGTLYLTVPHRNKPVEEKHFQHFDMDSITRYISNEFDVKAMIPFERKGIGRQILNMALCNRFFVLNSRILLDFLYGWYKRHLFFCSSERECQRIYVEATAK